MTDSRNRSHKPPEGTEAREEPERRPQAAPSAETQAATLDDRSRETLAERDAMQQKWLRAVADLENYRKRVQKEMEQERRYAALPLARDLLPALDNLQRALDAAQIAQDPARLIEGVQLVAKQLGDILARHDILPIEAQGKPFDPNLHQALQQVPAPDKPPMTVLAEVERGYTMHDRVVRPTTVIVSSASPAGGSASPDGKAEA